MRETKLRSCGFTLIEVLVASAVLALLVVLLASATSSTLSTVQRAQAKIDQFSAARAAFDRISSAISQATLNTYWDYDDPSNPVRYERKSDLHFLVQPGPAHGQEIFFQAPLEGSGRLNAAGFWVEYGGDGAWKPDHVATERHRYRLMQAIQPTADLSVFSEPGSGWVDSLRTVTGGAFPLADNVLAVILWPRRPSAQDPSGTALTGNFSYDSRSATGPQRAQLPPALDLVMIVTDEATASRMENGSAEPDAVKNALQNRFQSVADFETDLLEVRRALDSKGINHRVFSAPVTLRESNWSSAQ